MSKNQPPLTQATRVSYSWGAKAGPNNVHVSVSTDVREGESEKRAIKRAARIVETAVLSKLEEFNAE